MIQPVERIGDEYLVSGLGNFLSNQSPRWEGGHQGTQDGAILQFTVTEDLSSGRWSVTSLAHTPTRVNLATFEIVKVLTVEIEHRSAVYENSADSTARALTALGTRVRAIPGPMTNRTPWLTRLLDSNTGDKQNGQSTTPR